MVGVYGLGVVVEVEYGYGGEQVYVGFVVGVECVDVVLVVFFLFVLVGDRVRGEVVHVGYVLGGEGWDYVVVEVGDLVVFVCWGYDVDQRFGCEHVVVYAG